MSELRANLSRREFLEWWEFHKRNPIDPVSLHLKPAALIAFVTAANSLGGTRRVMQDYMDVLVPRSAEDDTQDWFDSLG